MMLRWVAVVCLLVVGRGWGQDGFYSLTPVRLMGGIDVSAASSAAPSAKFLLDASIEHPFGSSSYHEKVKGEDGKVTETSGPKSSFVSAPFWTSGYVRLASIATPGPVSGLSSVSSYVSTLGTERPDQIVQSAEAMLGMEYKIVSSENGQPMGDVKDNAPPLWSVHFVTEGGVITPLSPSQANPTPFVVSPSLYNYYASSSVVNADGVLGAASGAVTTACAGTKVDPKTSSSTTTCYVEYLPQDRTRFYRQWDTGLRFRWYYHSSDEDKHFLFPNGFSATFGQNEYVTRGELRNFVLHLAGSTSLPPNIGGSLAGLLYAYGAVDLNVSGANQNSQEFLLTAADTTAVAASSNVAMVTTPAPFRDRYRFGVALDLAKLITLIKDGSGAKANK